jgi:plastocyanin
MRTVLVCAMLVTFGCDNEQATVAPSAVMNDLSAAMPAATDGGAPSTFPMTAGVTVGAGNALTFSPSTVNIAAGGSVTWTWAAENTLAHNVMSGDSPAAFAASAIQTSGTYSVTFPTAGSFFYYCVVHGRNIMNGTVVVH